MSRIQVPHFLRAPRELTWRREERGLAHPGVSTRPSFRSGSWYPFAAKRTVTSFSPSTIFRVGARLVPTAGLDGAHPFKDRNSLNSFQSLSSLSLVALTRPPFRLPPSPVYVWPKTGLRSSAIRADIAVPTPSATGARAVFHRAVKSEFCHGLRPRATSASTTKGKRISPARRRFS